MKYDQEALDELVQEVFSDKAAAVNNSGQKAQIAFLLDHGIEKSHIDGVAGKGESDGGSEFGQD
jgi:hypothetical protein